MNQFDILPQNPARSPDAQSTRNVSKNSDGEANSTSSSDSENFNKLLEDLTKEGRAERALPSLTVNSSTASAASIIANALEQPDEGGKKADVIEGLFEQDPADEKQDDSSISSETKIPFSILESLLPKVLPQTNIPKSSNTYAPAGQGSPSDLSWIQNGLGDESRLGAGPVGRLMLSVQHQETHFKPIIDGFNMDPVAEGEDAGNDKAEVGLGVLLASQSKNAKPNLSQVVQGTPIDVSQANIGSDAPDASNLENTTIAEGVSRERIAAHPETTKTVMHNNAAADGSGLPASAFQKISGVVLAEANLASSAGTAHALHSDATSRFSVVKASEGVLRVLNLQLEPVELGLVTIKMRLSGDSIEMDLHVENEETAKLLRHDTEKLSALLRGAGYRPDAITIQSADSVSQDRFSTPRDQSGFLSQGQSFSQSEAGREQGSRNHNGQYEQGKTGRHKDADEDSADSGRNSGGVYL